MSKFKFLGVLVTVIGAGLTLVDNYVQERKNEEYLNELVDEKFKHLLEEEEA